MIPPTTAAAPARRVFHPADGPALSVCVSTGRPVTDPDAEVAMPLSLSLPLVFSGSEEVPVADVRVAPDAVVEAPGVASSLSTPAVTVTGIWTPMNPPRLSEVMKVLVSPSSTATMVPSHSNSSTLLVSLQSTIFALNSLASALQINPLRSQVQGSLHPPRGARVVVVEGHGVRRLALDQRLAIGRLARLVGGAVGTVDAEGGCVGVGADDGGQEVGFALEGPDEADDGCGFGEGEVGEGGEGCRCEDVEGLHFEI